MSSRYHSTAGALQSTFLLSSRSQCARRSLPRNGADAAERGCLGAVTDRQKIPEGQPTRDDAIAMMPPAAVMRDIAAGARLPPDHRPRRQRDPHHDPCSPPRYGDSVTRRVSAGSVETHRRCRRLRVSNCRSGADDRARLRYFPVSERRRYRRNGPAIRSDWSMSGRRGSPALSSGISRGCSRERPLDRAAAKLKSTGMPTQSLAYRQQRERVRGITLVFDSRPGAGRGYAVGCSKRSERSAAAAALRY